MPVAVPAITQVYFEYLFHVSTFDAIPTDQLYEYLFAIDEDDAFSVNFESLGYEGVQMVSNMGSTLLYIAVFFPVTLLYLALLSCCSRYEKIENHRESTWNGLFWNGILIFFDENFLMFATIGMLNFHEISFEKFGTILSFCFAVVFTYGALVFAFNVCLGYFINWDKVVSKEDETELEQDQRESFLERSGYFMDDLNTEKHGRWALLHPVLSILRRLFIAGSVVFLQNYPNFMVFGMILTTLWLLILYLHQRPFVDTFMNKEHVWYEGLTLVVGYHMIGWTDLNPLPDKRRNAAISMLTVFSIALVRSIWQISIVEGFWPLLKRFRAWMIRRHDLAELLLKQNARFEWGKGKEKKKRRAKRMEEHRE